MRIKLSKKNIKDPFVLKVQELSGQNLLACYQCGKCSAGCPAVSDMDILPNQIIRLAQLGQSEEHVEVKKLTDEQKAEVPPIALISCFRKFTS